MDVRVVRGLGVILVIAGLATCGRGGETEMSADCARMTDLAASGTAAAGTLPMPSGVAGDVTSAMLESVVTRVNVPPRVPRLGDAHAKRAA